MVAETDAPRANDLVNRLAGPDPSTGRSAEHRATITTRLDRLLEQLWTAGGTDLLLITGLPPAMRLDGDIAPVPGEAVLTGTEIADALRGVLSPTQLATFLEQKNIDFAFGWRNSARIRGNAYRQRGNPALALRIVPHQIPSVEDLGLPSVLSDLVELRHGLILVTGPTGSGKSTTLAALIDRVNGSRGCHILTIEDPIEYVHPSKHAVVSQREVGADTPTFASALRAALREDPDVVMVGEMRDLESIASALTIAETGHLVMATLHTNDATQTVSRIVDVFPAEQQAQVRTQLAAALTGVVCQRLIPRIGGGLVAAYEVLTATSAARALIKEGKTHQLRNVLLTGQREGMVTLEQSLSTLVAAGEITYEDALSRAVHQADVEMPRHLRGSAA